MIRRLVLLAAPLLALLAFFSGAATPAQPSARAADRVVLKSGRELFGKYVPAKNGWRSGVSTTVMGQPPEPDMACVTCM